MEASFKSKSGHIRDNVFTHLESDNEGVSLLLRVLYNLASGISHQKLNKSRKMTLRTKHLAVHLHKPALHTEPEDPGEVKHHGLDHEEDGDPLHVRA